MQNLRCYHRATKPEPACKQGHRVIKMYIKVPVWGTSSSPRFHLAPLLSR